MRAAVFAGPGSIEATASSPRCSTMSVAPNATGLDGTPEAYAAMDERRAIKSLLQIGAI